MVNQSISTETKLKIVVVAALMSEARPLIDHFRLKKVCDSPFTVFASTDSDVQIVICGMGSICAATAVGFMSMRDGGHNKAWLNVGIAGHRHFEVGSCLRVLSFYFEGSNRKQYISQTVPWQGQLAELITIGETSSDYPDSELIDMEGAGFFAAALHFNNSELVQSLKIVSDNAERGADSLNAEAISALVLQNRAEIVGFIDGLRDFLVADNGIANVADSANQAMVDWEAFVDCKMSHSQRQIIAERMQASLVLGLQSEAIKLLASAADFKQLDARLNQLLSSYSPQLSA